MDPVAFAEARLGEEKAGALACGDDDRARSWNGSDNGYAAGTSGVVCDDRGEIVVYDEGRPTEAQAVHIGAHDPARTLREVEAGRRILARHKDCASGGGYCDWWNRHLGPVCPDLADLLYRWADHVDYEPAWLPEEA